MQLQQKDQEIKECTICLDDIELERAEDTTKTICNHYFHSKCLNGWIYGEKKETCPNCRAKIIVHEKKRDKLCLYKLKGVAILIFGFSIFFSIMYLLREPLIDQAGKYF